MIAAWNREVTLCLPLLATDECDALLKGDDNAEDLFNTVFKTSTAHLSGNRPAHQVIARPAQARKREEEIGIVVEAARGLLRALSDGHRGYPREAAAGALSPSRL